MLPALVTRNDTVPWGTVAWSALNRMAPPPIIPPPPIMTLGWPIMGPPIFIKATFTTVPGRLGAAREEPDKNPLPPAGTPPCNHADPEDGPAMTPTATAAEATRAIKAAPSTPTMTGRLRALTSGRPGCAGERPAGPAMAPGRSRRWPGAVSYTH